MAVLIITNGDSAADLLKAAGKQGLIVPWRDSLNEGPLGALSSLEDWDSFRLIRSDYWVSRGAGDRDGISADYQQRDDILQNHKDYERIEIWLEHDLYDQLQLIEILTRLNHLKRFDDVYLVQAETYLGMMTPETILDLETLSMAVTEQMMSIADLAWQTVCSDTPDKLAEFVSLKPAGFPFLRQALHRFLEELPGVDGLSRTERQIIYSLDRGVTRPGMLFARSQAMEAAQFWGDWGFFHVLSQLQYCEKPLIEGLPEKSNMAMFQDGERRKAFLQTTLTLTPFGLDVLEGREDHASHNALNRYVGGTLIKPNNIWRFDPNEATLQGPPSIN